MTAVATDTRAVVVDILVGGPISGGSMNPARSLGPALLSGQPSALCVYLLGPPIGAVTGALLYRRVRGEQTRSA